MSLSRDFRLLRMLSTPSTGRNRPNVFFKLRKIKRKKCVTLLEKTHKKIYSGQNTKKNTKNVRTKNRSLWTLVVRPLNKVLAVPPGECILAILNLPFGWEGSLKTEKRIFPKIMLVILIYILYSEKTFLSSEATDGPSIGTRTLIRLSWRQGSTFIYTVYHILN